MRVVSKISLFTATALLFSGCVLSTPTLVKDNSYNRTKNGAAIGALAGAVIGAAKSKHALKGALLGAAAGAAVGGGVGYMLDKQANEVAEALGTGVDGDPLAAVDPSKSIVVSKGDKYVKVMFRDSMMFAFNSDSLQPSAKIKVEKLGRVISRYPKTIVQIAGFTDSKGSFEYNQNLSTRRAQNVANVLKSHNVPNQIYVKGCSYNKPLVPNNSDANRALNRRVEVYLYNNPADAVDPCH
jgi:outer membrane protein OmpA-like peptidoglycan-associated protein